MGNAAVRILYVSPYYPVPKQVEFIKSVVGPDTEIVYLQKFLIVAPEQVELYLKTRGCDYVMLETRVDADLLSALAARGIRALQFHYYPASPDDPDAFEIIRMDFPVKIFCIRALLGAKSMVHVCYMRDDYKYNIQSRSAELTHIAAQ
jgi:hypothetical protein